MDGVNNPLLGTVPAAPVQYGVPPQQAPLQQRPAVATDQLQLTAPPPPAAPAGPDPYAQLRMQSMSSNEVEVTGAMYGMLMMGPNHRAEVVQLMVERLRMSNSDTIRYAALDCLQRMKATEALVQIQGFAYSGPPEGLRRAAQEAISSIGGGTAAAPAPGVPGAQPPGAVPGAAPMPGAMPGGSAAVADIVTRMKDYSHFPAAAVDLAKLPTADVLAAAKQLSDDGTVPPQALELMVTVMSKRLKEPGVADAIAHVIDNKEPIRYKGAIGMAAMALAATHSPRYCQSLAKYLVLPIDIQAQIKRAVVDSVAATPAMAHDPAFEVALVAVLNGDGSNSLKVAASHALSTLGTPRARAALSRSKLLDSGDQQLVLRGLWDLQKLSGPLDPQARAKVQGLTDSSRKQIADLAKALLAKK